MSDDVTTEITIPLLPCRSIGDMLEFYRAMGFEVTYQQAKPNNYAVVRRGGIELHFFSMSAYDPAGSYSTCYVLTPDVDGLYAALTDGLRGKYGRVPSAGIPRVLPLKEKTGRREFIVVDPGGNWIRIGTPTTTTAAEADAATAKTVTTKLARAVHAASLLADAKGDYDAAAKTLDTALASGEPAPAADRVRALVARAGLAITMDDRDAARRMLAEVRAMPLSEEDRDELAAELERIEEYDGMLG